MGTKKELRIAILGCIFMLTCIAVYNINTNTAKHRPPPHVSLSAKFENITGYAKLNNPVLAENALSMLKMDDYIFSNYEGPAGKANLFISLYYDADKAYAAHSPLICYPSQGWKIEGPAKNSTLILGNQKIHLKEIVSSFGTQKELVLFWYQARLYSSSQAYINKIYMGMNKLFHNDERHSFIRVAVPFANKTYEETKTSAIAFIESFYPYYKEYIMRNR